MKSHTRSGSKSGTVGGFGGHRARAALGTAYAVAAKATMVRRARDERQFIFISSFRSDWRNCANRLFFIGYLLLAKVARWLNLIPSFPWIAPGWRAWGRNPRKERDEFLQCSVAEP